MCRDDCDSFTMDFEIPKTIIEKEEAVVLAKYEKDIKDGGEHRK